MVQSTCYSYLFRQIIVIYTHLNPINLGNRAINIFVSLLIHLLLLFATIRSIRDYSLYSVTIRSLFATIRTIRPLFVTIRLYSRLFATIRDYSRLFATIRDYSSLFVTIRDYSHYSVTIRVLSLANVRSPCRPLAYFDINETDGCLKLTSVRNNRCWLLDNFYFQPCPWWLHVLLRIFANLLLRRTWLTHSFTSNPVKKLLLTTLTL